MNCEVNCAFSHTHSTMVNHDLKAIYFWDETQKVCSMHHGYMLEYWSRDPRGRFIWLNPAADKTVRNRKRLFPIATFT